MVLNENLKALVGGIVAGLAALQTALISPGVTGNEIIVIVFAVLVGAGLVAATPDAETLAVMKETRENRASRRAAGKD